MAVNGRLRRLHVARRPRLNFYKAKHIRFPANQIDLSAVLWGPEVARHHGVTELPQMKVSVFLSAATGALVLRVFVSLLGRQRTMRQPIEDTDGRVSEASGQHGCPYDPPIKILRSRLDVTQWLL
jgi:hypothetical protein